MTEQTPTDAAAQNDAAALELATITPPSSDEPTTNLPGGAKPAGMRDAPTVAQAPDELRTRRKPLELEDTAPDDGRYRVRRGDTLVTIAASEAVTITALRDANRDKLDRIGPAADAGAPLPPGTLLEVPR